MKLNKGNIIKNFVRFCVIIITSIFIIISASYIYIYSQFSHEQLTFEYQFSDSPVKHIETKFEEIPRHCINALIATEDKTFWTNNGVDSNGTLRLILSALSSGSYGGGSTISQQIVKMGTNNYYNRNIFDKWSEIVKSIKLNNIYTKEELLNIYFNSVYFGDYNYGLKTAAKSYLNKDVKDLNRDECALLVGIIQLPNVYSPTIGNISLLEDRKERVLKLMDEQNY